MPTRRHTVGLPVRGSVLTHERPLHIHHPPRHAVAQLSDNQQVTKSRDDLPSLYLVRSTSRAILDRNLNREDLKVNQDETNSAHLIIHHKNTL